MHDPSEAPQTTIRVVAAVIAEGDRYLITQRRPQAAIPLRWEFPGGKVEPGESDADALKRELRHRLGVEVIPHEMISFVRHPYPSYRVDLFLYSCSLEEGDPEARNVNAFAWVRSHEFERYDFTPADEASMNPLLGIAGGGRAAEAGPSAASDGGADDGDRSRG
ncbi:MAG: (deoxy)nucleoside triphosphate pyrophosphohydrolase [Myxococcota bacterium]